MPGVASPQLNIYSSKDFLPSGIPHVVLLYPFWGSPETEPTPALYANFVKIGADLFRMSTAEKADFFVLPFDWRHTTRAVAPTEEAADNAKKVAQRLADRAADLGKTLIVFYVGDTDEELPLANAVVFRTSLRRGLRANEYAMTVFFEDFVGQKLGSYLPLRPKLRQPSVGFCGFAGYRLMPDVTISRKARRVARWMRDGLSPPTVREKAITHLRRHPSVLTDFLLVEHGIGWEGYAEGARDAFRRNIINTDYTLCARGAGNWSIRLYETLASARIPLFIDTECVLPYDFETNYRDYFVWVDSKDVESVGDQIVAFHDHLDDAEFAHMQRESRRIWEECLTPEGFFSNFHKHFNCS